MKNPTFLKTITLFLFFTTVGFANNPATNGSSTNWYTASAWTPSGVPNLTHDQGLQDVVVSHNMYVGNLTVRSGENITITGNYSLKNNESINVEAGGTLNITKSLLANSSGTSVTINGNLNVEENYKVSTDNTSHNLNGNVTVGGYFKVVGPNTVYVRGGLDITGELRLTENGRMQGYSGGHVTYGSYFIFGQGFSYLICNGTQYTSVALSYNNQPPANGMDFSTCGAYTLPVCDNVTNAGPTTENHVLCTAVTSQSLTIPLIDWEDASGGQGGALEYQWQIRWTPNEWYNITGATNRTYNPPNSHYNASTNPYGWKVGQNHWRRKAKRTCSNTWIESGSEYYWISENVQNPGSISGDESECSSYDPGNILNNTSASGGGGSGISYQWQYKTTGNWIAITGATDKEYIPGYISQTTTYRRGAIRTSPECNIGYKYSNEVIKTVTNNSLSLQCEYKVDNGGWISNNCSITLTQGQKLQLSTNPNNIFSYSWTGPNNFSGNGNSGGDILLSNSVTTVMSGIYTVTATDSNGCSGSKNITVNVVCPNPANNATAAASINENQTKTLTSSPSGGSWNIVSGGGTINGSTYTPANINTNTDVTIKYTIAADGACVATTDDATFTVTPVCAVASNTTSTTSITELQTKSLEGSPSGGTWSIIAGGGTINGNVYSPDDINTNTDVTIKYTIAADGSCDATTSIRTFTVTPVVISWDGSEDNDWSNVNNWSTNTLPANNNAVVVIPGGLSNYPTATEPVSVNSVIMNSGSSLIAAGTFTGIITYNRTLIDDWHLIASPVVGETIENMYLKNNFIEATNSDIGLASYLYDSNTWNYYKNTTTGAITSGQGYSSKLASLGDVSFTGTMATTDIAISSFGRTIDYNLVGNPYPSYINIESFLNENSNNLEEKTLWMYRYDDVELKRVYKPISLTSTLKHIAPTQGFFVQPKEESTVLNFRESMQSHQSVDTFQKTNSSERPEIKLLITNGTSTKYTDIFYIEGNTTGFDNGYDSSIFNSTASFSLYTNTITNSSGRKLAIQSLPNSDYESMVVPVGITADADKEITFSATAINLPAGIKVYLEDRELNVFTELIAVDTDVYKVDLAAAVNGVGRFYLHTSQKVLDVSDVPILTNIKIYTTTNTNLRIVGLPEGAKALKLYNIIGQEIMSTSFNTNGVKDIALPNLSKGVYTVQLKIGSEIIREKIFLE